MRKIAILLLLISSLVLAACGQTGPLYLPGDQPAKPDRVIVKSKVKPIKNLRS